MQKGTAFVLSSPVRDIQEFKRAEAMLLNNLNGHEEWSFTLSEESEQLLVNCGMKKLPIYHVTMLLRQLARQRDLPFCIRTVRSTNGQRVVYIKHGSNGPTWRKGQNRVTTVPEPPPPSAGVPQLPEAAAPERSKATNRWIEVQLLPEVLRIKERMLLRPPTREWALVELVSADSIKSLLISYGNPQGSLTNGVQRMVGEKYEVFTRRVHWAPGAQLVIVYPVQR